MNSTKRISTCILELTASFILCMQVTFPLFGAPDDIDISAANAVHTYTIQVNQPFNEQIAVLNAGGNVFWEFFNNPTGDTDANFTFMGLTVTLPAGSPGTAVSNGLTTSISGTPLTTGSFSFTITVTSENGVQSQNRQYDIIITQPMDLVLVFDRSGSMNGSTSAGVTRWDALKTAAGNFANMYQQLGRTNDRLSITYFETDLSPASACCNGFIPFVNNIGTTVSNDLNANAPGGWTAMGTGLKNAIGKLSDATKARSILLFTDGEQNQDPTVNQNGQGFSDASTIPGGNNPGGIKIATIGIGSPSPMYNTTLQNLAVNNRGSYNITADGTAFTFQQGNSSGDLTSGFSNQFVDMLDDFSPQLITTATTNVSQGSAPHTLLTFPLNQRVDKLLLEFAFDKNFESVQLVQLLTRILVQKNGASVMASVQPSWAGNFPNSLLLKIDFVHQVPGGPPVLDPSGNWTLQLADVAQFKITQCRVTVLADDHRLNYQLSYGNTIPRVDVPLKFTAHLDWLSFPITNATIEALVLRPGEDLGDLLAKNGLTVDVLTSQDAASPGVQKFDQLWATDQAFRNALALSENVVTLAHTSAGNYEGTFNGLTVAGLYKLIYRISGNHPDAGDYQRLKVENFYTTFNGVDLAASGISSQILNNQLVLQIRPVSTNGRFVGPAAGNAFSVDQPGVKITKVEDHQDGRYTLTFDGDINQSVKLSLLGQDVYTGVLADIGKGKGGGIIDKLQEWLESLGLPGWSLWILLLLLLILLWLLFRKKKP
ncbi:MAG TPA: VWA domain-containing protein [Saprospiraceae bacterium]|nr:VWA domain-containing protein [Saprospiraceae bacterium]